MKQKKPAVATSKKDNPRYNVVSFRITDEEQNWIDKIVKAKGITKTDLMRKLFDLSIAKLEKGKW